MFGVRRLWLWALGAGLGGCESPAPLPAPPPSATPSASAPVARAAPSASALPVVSAPAPDAGAAAVCPADTLRIPGGSFHMGSDSLASAPEEMPRFETEVADFCLDATEVTVDAYLGCVKSGSCTPSKDQGRFCNTHFPDRGNHPMNCVDWKQSRSYCEARGARLPSELEWEYAARGGSEYRAYSWGPEPPDGRTCWKHVGGTCRVKEYPAGAFGLFDMIGNVWEWTGDSREAGHSVRGASWAFEPIWARASLRGWTKDSTRAADGGFRCAR